MDKQYAVHLSDIILYIIHTRIQRLTVLNAGYRSKPVKSGLAGLRICALFHMFVTYCFLKSENKAGKISTESFPGRCVS